MNYLYITAPAVKDNILTKKDVSSAHQRVRLVVLGYCHGARGEIKAAKGVIGITSIKKARQMTGFLY